MWTDKLESACERSDYHQVYYAKGKTYQVPQTEGLLAFVQPSDSIVERIAGGRGRIYRLLLVEHVATGAEKPINSSSPPSNSFYNAITWLHKGEMVITSLTSTF
jgi:hypothetical protein